MCVSDVSYVDKTWRRREVGHHWSMEVQLCVMGVIEIKSDVRELSTLFLYPFFFLFFSCFFFFVFFFFFNRWMKPPIYAVGSTVNTKLALRQKKFQRTVRMVLETRYWIYDEINLTPLTSRFSVVE